jgi:hypothetical protein
VKIEDFRGREDPLIAAAKANAPDVCRTCRNLDVTRKGGELALSCKLAEAETDREGYEATVDFVNLALHLNTRLFSDIPDGDKMHNFRRLVEVAADDCPIGTSIAYQLQAPDGSNIIEIISPIPQ